MKGFPYVCETSHAVTTDDFAINDVGFLVDGDELETDVCFEVDDDDFAIDKVNLGKGDDDFATDDAGFDVGMMICHG